MDKRCTRCGEVKPRTEYDRSGRSGKMSYCKACRRKERNANYVPHPRLPVSVDPGQRFGRLTVVSEIQPRKRVRWVACVCDCGTQSDVRLHSLLRGETKSCGCYHRERRIELNRSAEHRRLVITHGLSKHSLYGTWTGMIARCEDERHHAFKNYGARGITVCPDWHDASVFIAWIEANLGPRPDGMTLDRMNNDLGYEPGNVRWATRSEQRRNRRRV